MAWHELEMLFMLFQLSPLVYSVTKIVHCLSVFYGAGSCRQRLRGVCFQLVNQLSRVSR